MGMSIPLKFFGFMACSGLLAACGGGGDSQPDDSVVTPPSTSLARCTDSISPLITTTSSSIRFQTEPNYVAGQSSTIIANILNRDSQDLTFRWQQIDGPNIALVSQNSPVLALDTPTAGGYRFSLHVTGSNLDVSGEIGINVDPASTGMLNVRQDHQVVEGNNVSLRLGQQSELSAANISWCVASGPDLMVDVSDPFRPLFTAPTVTQDTITRLKVNANVNGNQLSDDVFVLTTSAPAISSPYFDTPVARTHAYRPDSPYANVLANCVYSNQLNDSCTINTLPLIGQTSSDLNHETILNRVLVSHDWMGDNFAAFLAQMDPNSDFARLLQSVTAVVISYDVRPSFYWVVTGAIYLDPNDLWLTPSQRDTINEAPDYRSNFGNDLNFVMPWRYVKDNQYASLGVPITVRANRTLAQINPDLASLLYHELAHANDFFPRSVHATLTGPRLLDDYSRRNASKSLISDQVSKTYPLTSTEMMGLANVSFLGAAASNVQKAYQASDVSTFFSTDIASDFYAYSSTREDTAMLFEEAMMSYRYQILRDVAVTNKPAILTADSLIIDWGQRGRIAQDSLENRAALVIDEMLPELNGISLVESLPEPINMVQGQSWRQTLAISPANTQLKGQSNATAINAESRFEAELRLSGDRHQHPQQ
ncbi:hypothetical protein L5M43_01490 [Shewanella sp. SW36]|uniref:hypothetical protein n=1 Tax=unclassified Shewanella TaxID=196818 RepID=UPI0021DB6009|nr:MULTISPECIES: hypothetical protein [unclassified Shewanella]MCU7973943.1 hypothetical protein [Shewanella sp. SW36]MCU7989552.1 hypothetical protein [Shewanella sp. SW1]MCU8017515.1 hypothetical protein [Shewanella sp. SM72]MCU8050370.1 hypothetical protein [Shewanella sp. SM43]